MKPLSELFSSYTADAEASEFFGSVDDYTVKKSNINPNRRKILLNVAEAIWNS